MVGVGRIRKQGKEREGKEGGKEGKLQKEKKKRIMIGEKEEIILNRSRCISSGTS